MIDARWGESPPLSVGVEEEVMILDRETLVQVPRVETFLGEDDGFHTELHAAVVELKSGVHPSARDAAAEARRLRLRAAAVAEAAGLAVCASGTHPLTEPETLDVVDLDRYRAFVAHAGIVARRQGVNGLHVHVGMPSGAACVRCLEGVLPWLPVVLALSANSPYLAGRDTGLASNRAEVLATLPRSGAPPALRSYEEWERLVARLAAGGVVADYTLLWWDVRPHPRFGTLEVRMPDQPTSPPRTAAFVALVQALCAAALDRPAPAYDPPGRAVYAQNRWSALRFGPAALLLHPESPRAASAAELGAELLERLAPTARRLGSAEELAALDPSACEGERQLELGRSDGLRAVVSDLVARSLPSPG